MLPTQTAPPPPPPPPQQHHQALQAPPMPTQFFRPPEYFHGGGGGGGGGGERETAEQILLSSLRKLDRGKRSRTGLELKRSLLIAFTLFKARQILWQYSTPPIPVQLPSPQEEVYLTSEAYSPFPGSHGANSSSSTMLSTLEKDLNSDFWQNSAPEATGRGDEEVESDSSESDDDSDSDDIDIDEEDPFGDFSGNNEPIFPPPPIPLPSTFPLIAPSVPSSIPDHSPHPPSSPALTSLTTVVPGSEAHRNFDQNHPTALTHLANPIGVTSRKRPAPSPSPSSYCSSLGAENLTVSLPKREAPSVL